MGLTTAEAYELRQLCLTGRQVVHIIATGGKLVDPIGFAHHLQRFIELTEKAAGFDDPGKSGGFHLAEGE